MTERAELMRIYRSNGISSISLMRDHYNKHDNGGDIQPSDATFRATLTNPVNSYRSNAPAGIGDAASPEEAITYFTNPSPKGFETTRGPGIYTSNSTDYQDYIDLFNRQMERAFKEKTE